jgi:hypothetical protein
LLLSAAPRIFSYAEDDVYVPPDQFASSDMNEVVRDSSAFDGGSGSTVNTATQTPVEAYGSGVPDVGPSGPVDQQ